MSPEEPSYSLFHRILFPTDFSDYAKKTLDCLAGLPDAREIVLLHVVEETRSPRGGGEIGDELFRAGKNYLKEEKTSLEKLGQQLRVTTMVKTSSDTAGAIVDSAEEAGVSLIVVGARGNSLVEGILLGSISKAVLRRSKTSVLIMRHKIIEQFNKKNYEMFCPLILSSVLCPVDFSSYSDTAVTLAGKTKGMGEMLLLHVVSQGETENEIEDSIRLAEDKMRTLRENLVSKGINVRTIVKRGNPSYEITHTADKENVSVIWMSSQGKGWFRDLLLGSTAYSVAINARQPVIIIRAPDKGERSQIEGQKDPDWNRP